VTSDLRHMADAGRCAGCLRSGIGALHRIPPSRVLSGPGPPVTPTPQPGPRPETTVEKSGARPYIRATPRSPTPPGQSYCARSLKAGLRPSAAKKKPGGHLPAGPSMGTFQGAGTTEHYYEHRHDVAVTRVTCKRLPAPRFFRITSNVNQPGPGRSRYSIVMTAPLRRLPTVLSLSAKSA
jgi:hypothetical protein